MSEIKTCEEFVVNKLFEYENKILVRDEYIKELETRLQNIKKLQELVMSEMEIKMNASSYRSMSYIGISASVWQDDNGFAEIKRVLEDKYHYDFAGNDEEKTE